MLPQHVRHQLTDELGFDIADATWEYLVEKGYVEDVLVGAMAVYTLADEARAILRAAGQRVGRTRRAPRTVASGDTGTEDSRGWPREAVLSRLIAAEAEKDEAVREFRAEVLGGQLLSSPDVQQWISDQQGADGEATTWITVSVPSGHEVIYDPDSPEVMVIAPPLTISREDILATDTQRRMLAYGVPNAEEERYVSTTAGGALERLRQLSERLAKNYGWTAAQAVVFVLTGEIPQVAPIRAAAHVSYPLTTLTRLTLTIDPALSPREVANHYRDFRREVVGGRHRNLSEKHLQLALFAALRPEEETWATKMSVWNSECQHPRWRYTSERNFARDCRVAQERLLRPKYQIPTWVDEDYVEEV